MSSTASFPGRMWLIIVIMSWLKSGGGGGGPTSTGAVVADGAGTAVIGSCARRDAKVSGSVVERLFAGVDVCSFGAGMRDCSCVSR